MIIAYLTFFICYEKLKSRYMKLFFFFIVSKRFELIFFDVLDIFIMFEISS